MSVETLVFTFLASWGRVVGPEVGPEQKWQGLGPALSIDGAATGGTPRATGAAAKMEVKGLRGHWASRDFRGGKIAVRPGRSRCCQPPTQIPGYAYAIKIGACNQSQFNHNASGC